MKLLFEKSSPGRKTEYLASRKDEINGKIDPSLLRKSSLNLPELSEIDVDRHYSELERRTHGVNNGIYMLGSCTMKYNPPLHEQLVSSPQFTALHPLQPTRTTQGALAAYSLLEQMLNELCGMDNFNFQAAAGAQGELAGLLVMKAYHLSKGDTQRDKILIPDAAHGTNPASAAMAGFKVVSIPALPDGGIDVEALKSLVGEDTAGLMLTNPNTEGQFEKNILEITRIIHEAGGVNYYDGANLNAIMGVVRPGDMGFDVVHLNLHKTLSTPHGGGGPGSGAVGVKKFLTPFLPGDQVRIDQTGALVWDSSEQSIGQVTAFHGNYLVALRALIYMISLGSDGLREASQVAVLNANYMQAKLKDIYSMSHEGLCMHEFVMSLEDFKKETGVSAKDIAKGLLDFGMHPPTMYFPLTVHEALMIEPTETEPKESLDKAIQVFRELYDKAHSDAEYLLNAPHSTPVSRPDEALAARSPKLRYEA